MEATTYEPDDSVAAITTRLDRLISLMRIIHADEIDVARARIRADKPKAVILDACAGRWVSARALRDQVAKQTKLKERAIQLHLGDLWEWGALKRRGSGRSVEYRSTELL